MGARRGRFGPGKKMRVAAAFTGTAALATAFTPVLATEAKASSLRSATCTGHPHWLHLRHYDGSSSCWGFKGGRSLSWIDSVTSECGGNNYGFLIWSSRQLWSGREETVKFHEGTTYAKNQGWPVVRGVHISGWKGSDAC